MLIVTTGYYSTGSSAVFSLLKEYDSCTKGKYPKLGGEQILLYVPNGLFDLEDKLLRGNNIHRSDEALQSFHEAMNALYCNNYVSFGNYKRLFGQEFMDAVDELIERLTEIRSDCMWYNDYEMRFSFKHTLANIRNLCLGRPISANFFENISYKKKEITRYSFVTEEKFYDEAQKFIGRYLHMFQGENNKNLILDHFLLPHNLYRVERYFLPDEIRIIVVDRDPRDTYMDALRRRERGFPAVPGDVKDFVKFWKKLRENEKRIDAGWILRIRFEDLIYNYDDTVGKIEQFCGLKKENHTLPRQYLKPEQTAEKMPLFLSNQNRKEEIKYIEDNLPEYLYLFPNYMVG